MTRTNQRALANWPNNAVSVLDFGAVGDGASWVELSRNSV